MPPPSSERVYCNLEFAFNESSGGSYVLFGRDDAGLSIFQFSVPAAIIESAVFINSRATSIMSPDGTIQILADGLSFDNPIGLPTNVRDLIVQAIDQKMFEDEPDAEVMLQTLRKRLLSSLTAVDDAIADFSNNRKPRKG